jgi:hypothetical protein
LILSSWSLVSRCRAAFFAGDFFALMDFFSCGSILSA